MRRRAPCAHEARSTRGLAPSPTRSLSPRSSSTQGTGSRSSTRCSRRIHARPITESASALRLLASVVLSGTVGLRAMDWRAVAEEARPPRRAQAERGGHGLPRERSRARSRCARQGSCAWSASASRSAFTRGASNGRWLGGKKTPMTFEPTTFASRLRVRCEACRARGRDGKRRWAARCWCIEAWPRG